MLVQEEKQIKNGKEQIRIFKWITNFEITKKNAVKIARGGRVRWKIENQGFNRQKHWQGNLEHACSWNAQAQKNHYLMQQIADFMRQLYEYFYLKKNEMITLLARSKRHEASKRFGFMCKDCFKKFCERLELDIPALDEFSDNTMSSLKDDKNG